MKPEVGKRNHTSDYKTLALDYLQEEGVTIVMASKKFGISKQTLHTWRKEHKANTEMADPETHKPVHERAKDDQKVIDSLIEENRSLRMELEILKKFNALLPLKIRMEEARPLRDVLLTTKPDPSKTNLYILRGKSF